MSVYGPGFAGSITAAAQTVEFTTELGFLEAGLAIQLTGTWSATLIFECTVDGTNWVSIQGANTADGSYTTAPAANGIWRIIGDGVRTRIRCSAWVSGIVVITGNVIRGAY